MNSELGFIILRHVNSKYTEQYWKHCYKSIRKYYTKENILIIDDNSNYKFIDEEYEKTLANTKIIKSEYTGRGELLPYIYFLKNKHCDMAMILHDSCFINKKICFTTNSYCKLWDFKHNWNNPKKEKKLLLRLNNNTDLLKIYNNRARWTGCFGAMAIINYNYLDSLNNKYNLNNLIDGIRNRSERMNFERVIAIILQSGINKNNVLCGNIHKYCKWGLLFNEINTVKHLPFIKVWTGR